MNQEACQTAYRVFFGSWKDNKQKLLAKQVHARRLAFRHGAPHTLHCSNHSQQAASKMYYWARAGQRGWTERRLRGEAHAVNVSRLGVASATSLCWLFTFPEYVNTWCSAAYCHIGRDVLQGLAVRGQQHRPGAERRPLAFQSWSCSCHSQRRAPVTATPPRQLQQQSFSRQTTIMLAAQPQHLSR